MKPQSPPWIGEGLRQLVDRRSASARIHLEVDESKGNGDKRFRATHRAAERFESSSWISLFHSGNLLPRAWRCTKIP
jgi:hypothetical protein